LIRAGSAPNISGEQRLILRLYHKKKTSTQAGGYERQTRVLVKLKYIISGQSGH
jgi:hypothetical protein